MAPYLKRVDLGIFLPISFLAIVSILVIFSAAPKLLNQQIIWFFLGLTLMVIISLIDIRPLINSRSFVLGIYAAAVILLILTAIFAPTIRHTKSWIVIGS